MLPERNLENDLWGFMSWSNSSDEVWELEWVFMVGTARPTASKQTQVRSSVASSLARGPFYPADTDTVQYHTSHCLLLLSVGGTLWSVANNIPSVSTAVRQEEAK